MLRPDRAYILDLARALIALLLFLPQFGWSAPVTDPVAAYLAMNIPDRARNAGRLLVLKTVEVDLSGKGDRTVFVGTWYRNSGPNTWLWAGFAPTEGGYELITPKDSDLLIDFEGIYIGVLPDIGRYGMAQAYSLELDNKDRDQSNLISDLTFYYLDGKQLVEKGSGPLDRNDPQQRKIFDFYFGLDRKISSKPRISSYTVVDLIRMGYKIPRWSPF
ncbi:MAG: hypothetical protein JO076_03045 [Verrucomicrobia bacterium]|nr:hypothetical protein [Verrucomicrobiota bacterium]